LLKRLAALDWLGNTSEMADVVRGTKFIEDGQIPVVPELLSPAQHELLVFLSGHGFALLPPKQVRN